MNTNKSAIGSVKNKKKIFNFKLYTDVLKQLKIPGFILAAICLAVTLLPLVFRWLNGRKIQYVSEAFEMAPIMFGFVYVAPIIMVFSAFAFLSKRNASDFYHSLPDTRACQYISIGAAVLTWLYATIAINILASALMHLVSRTSFLLSFIPFNIAYYIAIATLIAGAAMIAVSVSGTPFTNFVVMCIILIIPRYILTFGAYAIDNLTKIVNAADTGFLSPNLNLIFGGITTLFSYYNEAISTFVPSIIYTFVLGAIYIAAGIFLYKKRKSETANKSAPNRLMQHVYRCAVTLPLTLLIGIDVFTNNMVGSFDIEGTIFILVLSVLIYFSYELITTKKFKNLLKTVPVFLILIAFSFAIGWTYNITAKIVLNDCPDADKVEYVDMNFWTENSSYLYDGRYSDLQYYELMIKNKKSTDPIVNGIFCDALRATVHSVKNGTYNSWERGDDLIVKECRFVLKNGRKIVRKIDLSQTQYNEILSIRMNEEGYRESIRKLPKNNEIYSYNMQNDAFNAENAKEIWLELKDEIAALSDNDYALVTGLKDIGNTSITVYNTLVLRGAVNTENFVANYAITSLTPKTLEKMLNMQANKEYPIFKNNIASAIDSLSRDSADIEYISFRAMANNADALQGKYFNGTSIDIEYYTKKTDDFSDYYDSYEEKQYAKALAMLRLFNEIELTPVIIENGEPQGTVIYVQHFNWMIGHDVYGMSYPFYMSISEEDLARLLNINEGIVIYED